MAEHDFYDYTEEELERGITLTREKSSRLLKDARILIMNKGSPDHCLALYIFALEEYGKCQLLQDAKRKGPKNDKYYVSKNVFAKGKAGGIASHIQKIQRAFKDLPDVCKQSFKSVTVHTNTLSPSEGAVTFDEKDDGSIGILSIPYGITGTLTDLSHGKPIKLDVYERMTSLYIGWDVSFRKWIPDARQRKGLYFQIGVSSHDLLKATDELEKRLMRRK